VSLLIKEVFTVNATPERVFAFLNNPAEVVTCLPGAELTETLDDRTYGGRVKVKVGPISTAYAGRATLTEVDAASRRVRITGEGKESGGAGSARLQLVAVATPVAGGTEVSVDATIDIAGRVMQFGRGLIESVSKQLFAQFVEAARAKLEVTPTPAATAEVPRVLPVPEPVKELKAFPLLVRALLAWLRGLFTGGKR
jgi:carbon monoxide dehydrogenase subunit G